jgi:N-terminal domain of NWD NACHT-NTPase
MEYVLERMDWFISLSGAVMKRDWPENHPFQNHRESTLNETVKLFQYMLKFEMECACRAYNNKDHPLIHALLHTAKDMIQLGSWDDKVKDIKELDAKISEDIEKYKAGVQMEYSVETAENTANLLVEVRQIRLLEEDNKVFAHDERLTKLVSRFGNTTYFDQMRLNPLRHPGTCRWFRSHPKYKEWLKSSQNDLLLVTAEPGCGKSVLSRCLIEQDLPSRRRPGSNVEPVVCYFFFKDNTIQNSLINALGAVIHQLLVASEVAALKFVKEINSMSDEMLQGPYTLWRLFEGVADHEAFEGRTIYCVFDALDECASVDRSKLIELLQDHLKQKKRIQFLITGRPNPDIVDAFQESEWAKQPMCLEGEGDKEKDDLQKEIDIVFRYKIDSLIKSKRRSPEVATLINEKLHAKGAGQRTYLWVRLLFELLKTAQFPDLSAWEAFLDDLPDGVPGAYDKLLSNVNPKYRDDVLVLLNIIYIAYQPLSLKEANIAIHVRGKYDIGSMKDLRLDDKSFRAWLRKECGFFITEYDNHLFFIHQTAREFLRDSKSMEKNDETAKEQDTISEPPQADGTAALTTKSTKAWRNSIKSDADAHFVISECCIANMMLTWRDPNVQHTARVVEDIYIASFDEYGPNKSKHLDTHDREWGPDADALRDGEGFQALIWRSAIAHEEECANANGFFAYSDEMWYRHFNDCEMNISEDPCSDTSVQAKMAMLAAFQSLLEHPLRSVFTSGSNIEHLGKIERRAWLIANRVENLMKDQDMMLGKQLQTLLRKVEVSTFIRCSPVVWACFQRQPWLIRRYIGKNREGNYRRLDISHLCNSHHSEDLEILLSIVMTFYHISSPLSLSSSATILHELLQYEEHLLQDNPEREQYFRDILWFVRFGILDVTKGDGSIVKIISLDEIMEKHGIGEEERRKIARNGNATNIDGHHRYSNNPD